MENNFLGKIDKFMSLEIFVALVPNTIKTPGSYRANIILKQ